MRRIFVDLDGPVVDFDGLRMELGLSGAELKVLPGAYARMRPVPGALEALRTLLDRGYEVFLATKAPSGIAHAYADKAQWVFQHAPEFTDRLIITQDKGLLGDAGDFLIDDRPHAANCAGFPGTLLLYRSPLTWEDILSYFDAGGAAAA